jgi:hypothetical protein
MSHLFPFSFEIHVTKSKAFPIFHPPTSITLPLLAQKKAITLNPSLGEMEREMGREGSLLKNILKLTDGGSCF